MQVGNGMLSKLSVSRNHGSIRSPSRNQRKIFFADFSECLIDCSNLDIVKLYNCKNLKKEVELYKYVVKARSIAGKVVE